MSSLKGLEERKVICYILNTCCAILANYGQLDVEGRSKNEKGNALLKNNHKVVQSDNKDGETRKENIVELDGTESLLTIDLSKADTVILNLQGRTEVDILASYLLEFILLYG